MHFKAERSIVAKMTSSIQENQFVMQAINNWSNEIGKKERKKWGHSSRVVYGAAVERENKRQPKDPRSVSGQS